MILFSREAFVGISGVFLWIICKSLICIEDYPVERVSWVLPRLHSQNEAERQAVPRSCVCEPALSSAKGIEEALGGLYWQKQGWRCLALTCFIKRIVKKGVWGILFLGLPSFLILHGNLGDYRKSSWKRAQMTSNWSCWDNNEGSQIYAPRWR